MTSLRTSKLTNHHYLPDDYETIVNMDVVKDKERKSKAYALFYKIFSTNP